MGATGQPGHDPAHDRALLLAGAKRNQLLELWEVQKYGADSFADPDYVRIYGLKPEQWYGRGVRLLGRTAVECTRDLLGGQIGRDVADVARGAPTSGRPLVLDPFAGSGNTLYWIVRHMRGSTGIGFELDETVFELSRRNLAIVGAPVELQRRDFAAGLEALAVAPNQLLVVFVAPPWGDALDESSGLDLGRTLPPVVEIVDRIGRAFASSKILYAVQVYERLEQRSLSALTARFDWSALRIYQLNEPGRNHGILMGTLGWAPQP